MAGEVSVGGLAVHPGVATLHPGVATSGPLEAARADAGFCFRLAFNTTSLPVIHARPISEAINDIQGPFANGCGCHVCFGMGLVVRCALEWG